jgi:O-antigen ligase
LPGQASIDHAKVDPVFGTGAGTHVYYGRLFRRPRLQNADPIHAHNDYLEMLADTGVVGMALFVWMLVGVFRSGFSKVMDRDDEEGRLLTLAALTGIVGILIHSFIDFNLHIPANAALFFVLCAAVAAPFKHKIKPAEFRPWISDPEEDLEGGL